MFVAKLAEETYCLPLQICGKVATLSAGFVNETHNWASVVGMKAKVPHVAIWAPHHSIPCEKWQKKKIFKQLRNERSWVSQMNDSVYYSSTNEAGGYCYSSQMVALLSIITAPVLGRGT